MDKHDKRASWIIRNMGYGQTLGSAMKWMWVAIALMMLILTSLMKLQH